MKTEDNKDIFKFNTLITFLSGCLFNFPWHV